jgi:quinone-modifying oxidoreductase subunit QmoC
MIWVQWGLKERALGNASIWLCHQCATCSAYCPRDARPANVMAALRDYSISHYAAPAAMGRALADPRALPLLLALPLAIFLVILAGLGHLTRLPEGPVVFSRFLPIIYIEAVFLAGMAASGLAAVVGGLRYWRAMGRQAGAGTPPARQGLWPTLADILSHRTFARCLSNAPGSRETHKRHLHRSHLLVFWGFLGLVVTTTSVGIGIYAFGYLTPWPLWHPVKILGNASGLAVLAAVAAFAWRRVADAERAGKSTYSDWLFLAVLGLTALTGFAIEGLRLAGTRLAYPVYVVHLVLIFFLLVYIPYGKFAHLVYRVAAMLRAASSAERPVRAR